MIEVPSPPPSRALLPTFPTAFSHRIPRGASQEVDPDAPLMIEFVLSNSRALWPFFRTNSSDGSPFAQTGSHLAQNTTPSPCSLLSCHTVTYTHFGDMYIQKRTNPTPKHPFSWPELGSVQNDLLSGQPGS